jgi:hypothetical protein
MNVNAHESLDSRLPLIVGRTLSSVVFIHDYIQLIFDRPTLITYSPPFLRQSGNELVAKQPGYCDAIYSQIGVRVTKTNVIDDELTIRLVNAVEIVVSLLAPDYVGPEALVFDSSEGIVVA